MCAFRWRAGHDSIATHYAKVFQMSPFSTLPRVISARRVGSAGAARAVSPDKDTSRLAVWCRGECSGQYTLICAQNGPDREDEIFGTPVHRACHRRAQRAPQGFHDGLNALAFGEDS